MKGFPYTWVEDWGEDEAGLWAAFAVRGVRHALRWIPPGTFLMGSPADEAGRYDDEPQHRVTLSQGYWLGETAVPQALWQAVMGENPSRFKGAERPVERVSWDDCQSFIARLNELKPGLALRLPTEAEWEYACRAGTTTAFHFGNQITPEMVNYHGNYPYAGGEKGLDRDETVAVKALPGNRWGLYQMHGNVWEWCSDWFEENPSMSEDPQGPQTGAKRVLRGGSWDFLGGHVRAASRDAYEPGERYGSLGFRFARGQAL
jgi:formylglycine-generating enzyme